MKGWNLSGCADQYISAKEEVRVKGQKLERDRERRMGGEGRV